MLFNVEEVETGVVKPKYDTVYCVLFEYAYLFSVVVVFVGFYHLQL